MTANEVLIQLPENKLTQIIEKAVKNALDEKEREKKHAKLLEQEYITINEACQILRIGRTAIYQRINSGRLKRIYINDKPYIPTEQLR